MAAETSSQNSPKRSRKSNNVVDDELDRASNLPNTILHHILSFLDTKHAVQTSLLSRRWRCLWKDLPVLNLSGFSFPDESTFTNYVYKVLSHRFDSASVSTIHMDFGLGDIPKKTALQLFDSVMNHAGAPSRGHHNLRRLSVWSSAIYEENCFDMVGCIVTYGHHQSLKTLKLTGSEVKAGSLAGFKVLASLELSGCCFFSTGAHDQITVLDAFSSLPCLSRLKVENCSTWSKGCRFVVSGSELVELHIRVGCDPLKAFKLVEVSAPKLKVFAFDVERRSLKHRLKMNVPCLERANVQLRWSEIVLLLGFDWPEVMKRLDRSYVHLLRGLHNVESLVLGFSQREQNLEQEDVPLTNMKSIMKSEVSPFTRLKALRVQYNCRPLPRIPYHAIRYFFGNLSNLGEKFIRLEMITHYMLMSNGENLMW